MARYLLFLHGIDDGAGLLAAARDLSKQDPGAEFVMVMPTVARAIDLLLEPGRSPRRFAAIRARRVRDQLVAAGVNLIASRLGNFDPFRALEDALRFSDYAAVIVAGPQHRFLHLIRCDLPCRLARRFPDMQVRSVQRGHYMRGARGNLPLWEPAPPKSEEASVREASSRESASRT